MAMIEKIRKQRSLLLIMVGLGLLSFLVPYDAVMSMFGGSNSAIGEIDGKEISAQDWQAALQEREPLFQYNGNQTNLSNDTWNQLVENILYQDEFDALGIQITDEEYDEVTFGTKLSPFVLSTIYGGQDSLPLRDQVRAGFDRMSQGMAEGWKKLIKAKRQKEKYDAMVKKGLYANSIDAKWAFKESNDKVSIDYVVKSFASIPDSTVTWTESDLHAYYNKHKNDREYRQETSRTVEYISFPVMASAQDSALIREDLEKIKEEFRTATNDSVYAIGHSAIPSKAFTRLNDGLFPLEIETSLKNDSVGKVVGPVIYQNTMGLIKINKRGISSNEVEARHILIKDKATGKATLDSLKTVISKNKNFEDMARQYSQDPGSGAQGGSLGRFGRGQMVKPFEDACFNGSVGSLQIVESEFGWHLIEVTGKNFPYTQIALVERVIEPSSKTVKSAYALAKEFTINYADTASFRNAADTLNGGTKITVAKNIRPNATSVMGLSEASELVSWSYSAELGEVSQPMLSENKYIIAALTEVKEKGAPTFDNMYEILKAEVIKEKKAELYVSQMNEGSLSDIASKVGAEVKKAENITLRSSNIPGSGVSLAENTVIGACFGLGTGKMSKAIVGKGGIYVIQRSADIAVATSADNYLSDQDKTISGYQQRSITGISNAFREAGNVEDNRYARR